MVNQISAAALIKRLDNLNRDVAKCGILSSTVTAQEYFQLEKLCRSLTMSFYNIEQATPHLRLDRLRDFVKHLKTKTLLLPFQMSFSSYQSEYSNIFPDYWQTSITKDGLPISKYKEIECETYIGERFFFGLSQKEHYHLFFEYNQNSEWGNIKITGRTGKAKFIENIEQFIAYFEKGGRQC